MISVISSVTGISLDAVDFSVSAWGQNTANSSKVAGYLGLVEGDLAGATTTLSVQAASVGVFRPVDRLQRGGNGLSVLP